MRNYFWVPLVLLVISGLGISLTACNPSFPISASPTLTNTPTLTPLPTSTNTPSPEPTPALPPGFISIHNEDGTWGIGIKRGNEITPISGVSVDAAGFHITVAEGQVVDIPTDEVKDRIKAGQNSPFQIYNQAGTAILFAYDVDNKVWVDASKVLHPDKNNSENLIIINRWDEVDNLSRLEKMLLPPFPKDTYFPDLDKIIIDYLNINANQDIKVNFNFFFPFGNDIDPTKSPFKFVNYSFLAKGEDRTIDILIVTEQVFNPKDGTFSLLHFGYTRRDPIISSPDSIFDIRTQPGRYFLPEYYIEGGLSQPIGGDLSLFRHLINQGFLNPDGTMPEIKKLVEKWLTTGIVPPEMEKFIFLPFPEPRIGK